MDSLEAIKAENTQDAHDLSRSVPPRFTIVIPTRHRNELLALCLEAVRPQAQGITADEYEVVVTDDGSNSTAEAMISQRFPWVRWVAGPRRGPAANRNNGAREARGEWLVFTDDDCIPSSQWLCGYKRAIEPGVLVYEGKTTGDGPRTSLLDVAPINLDGGRLWSCNMMVARDTFLKMGGFDETFPYAAQEDSDFRERLRAEGLTFPFVEEALINHPPRPAVLGTQLGKMQESRVLIWYKGGNTQPTPLKLLRSVVMTHLRDLRQTGVNRDALRLLSSLFSSLTYVARHAWEWDARYRRKYVSKTPQYRYPYL